MASDEITLAIADHIQWCRGERDRLREALAAHRAGTRIDGEPQNEIAKLGTITHVMCLEKTIRDLGRVIDAFSPPASDQPPPV
ncbi:MAG TPA: hypothetical protein VMU08_10215 [Rhizomicrobium sp.]|nr:hypothetical protein [Rhizomicrobium sp.]